MKKILFFAAALFLAAACTEPKMEVTVKNLLTIDRANETVEIPWHEVTAKLKKATSENIVVFDETGMQIPSQIIYNGMTEPQWIIFQANVSNMGISSYTITTGQRNEYPTQAFGRFVPERKDDYAWENNLAAYRIYGPALSDPQTPGIDVWVKSTQKMVIDEWYAKDDYHHNYGEGMDAYKVGVTLGGGACAPFVDGKLWLSGNYATYKTLDNGPIRTSVKLTYEPFKAGSYTVSYERTISLDANTWFSKMTNVFSGDFETLPIGAGIVIHKVKDKVMTNDYIALTEELSDTKQPEVDGDVSLAVIMPAAKFTTEADGHMLVVGDSDGRMPLVYWTGAGWSQAGITDAATWNGIVGETSAKLGSPLQVIY